jgi:hypothetical protein
VNIFGRSILQLELRLQHFGAYPLDCRQRIKIKRNGQKKEEKIKCIASSVQTKDDDLYIHRRATYT